MIRKVLHDQLRAVNWFLFVLFFLEIVLTLFVIDRFFGHGMKIDEAVAATQPPSSTPVVPGSVNLDIGLKAGLNRLLSSADTKKQNIYPIWSRENGPIEFFVFNAGQRFYSGVFFAHLTTLAEVTKTEFSPGNHPHLVAIMADNLHSWQDVDDFLAKQQTSFRLPLAIRKIEFTGCNAAEFFNKGYIDLGIIIVDVTQTRSLADINDCTYKSLMGVFGFDPQPGSKNIALNLQVLQSIYSLNIQERQPENILDAVSRIIRRNR